jgi:hypothetical protein
VEREREGGEGERRAERGGRREEGGERRAERGGRREGTQPFSVVICTIFSTSAAV